MSVFIESVMPNKISKVEGYDLSLVKFRSSCDFIEYFTSVLDNELDDISKCHRIENISGKSKDLSGKGSWKSGDLVTVVISGDDLESASPGDGPKIIKIFVKNMNDEWVG